MIPYLWHNTDIYGVEKIIDLCGITDYKINSNSIITVKCIFHKECTPSLKFYPSETYFCYGCHANGDIKKFCDTFDISAEECNQIIFSYYNAITHKDQLTFGFYNK